MRTSLNFRRSLFGFAQHAPHARLTLVHLFNVSSLFFFFIFIDFMSGIATEHQLKIIIIIILLQLHWIITKTNRKHFIFFRNTSNVKALIYWRCFRSTPFAAYMRFAWVARNFSGSMNDIDRVDTYWLSSSDIRKSAAGTIFAYIFAIQLPSPCVEIAKHNSPRICFEKNEMKWYVCIVCCQTAVVCDRWSPFADTKPFLGKLKRRSQPISDYINVLCIVQFNQHKTFKSTVPVAGRRHSGPLERIEWTK